MTDSTTTPSKATTAWPTLSYPDWKDTLATLHLWTQIVGKVRLMRTPWLNHSWHVVLYVTSRGMTTSPIPDGERSFEVHFDFIDHELCIVTSDGRVETVALRPMTVAEFYREFMSRLSRLGISVRIHPVPVELPEVIRFDQDETHASYDAAQANRFWCALYHSDRVLKRFRTRFIGKSSPVHFFWGSFDLAVTRFSGRTAPKHPGGMPNLPDWVAQEAYSHEVASVGFWPGGDMLPEAVFYAYGYPEPASFAQAQVRPEGAQWHDGLREFVLPYRIVQSAPDPETALLEFAQSTYEAVANLAHWDRAALERPEIHPRKR
jgi:hypothetical protein